MNSLSLRIPTLLLAVLLAAPLHPQQPTQLQDPANLTGEQVSPQDPADTLPLNHGTPALQQLLLKLRTRASFMLIVAHPDDEDGGLLTYLSRGQGARVAMLTLNRGEGGQNLMSADFDDALGLIRTQELLAADRYMGVDQFFGTEVDFGFSKTKEEAFAKWTHERVLYDAVRAVRLYRPLVIASVFIGAPSDGHGQHQVAGQIAQEVFNAAGDPKVFPDQIAQGLQPWQPLKVYARVPYARIVTDATGTQTIFDSATNQYTPALFTNYVTGQVTTSIPPASVVIPEGDPATYTSPEGTKTPIPGMENLSYVQFAAKGRSLQKTQFGPNARPATPGPHDVSYHRYASKLPCLQPLQSTPATSSNAKPSDNQIPVQAAHPHLGTPSLQARVSPPLATNGALAPGVCPPSALEPTLFSGIDTSLPGLADLVPEASDKLRPTLKKIDAQIAEAQRLFTTTNPERTAPPLRLALLTLDQTLHELEDSNINDLDPIESYNLLHELRIKRVQLNNALLLALGIRASATVIRNGKAGTPLTPGSVVSLEMHLSNGGSQTLPVDEFTINLRTTKTWIPLLQTSSLPIEGGGNRSFSEDVKLLYDAVPTKPYFHRSDIEQAVYQLDEPGLRNSPSMPSPLTLDLNLTYQSIPIHISQAVQGGDEATVDAAEAAVIVPRISVALSPRIAIISTHADQNASLPFAVTVRSNISTVRPHVEIRSPDAWKITPPTGAANTQPLLQMGDTYSTRWSVLPANLQSGSTQPILSAFGIDLTPGINRAEYSQGYRAVGYPGLAYTNYYTPSTYKAVAIDVTTAPNLNIAYLPGTGDGIPAALDQLAQLGVHAHILTTADLTPESLKLYDAIILGVRAYEAHPELAAANPALNAYAANGGIVIAQYNTARLPENTGPYPLTLGPSEKVVEEDAPVQILAPTNPLLTWPNHITSADFDGWIEERGHGFMSTWDPHYTPLLETHDHGQQPQRGGLLVARTGKGAWIYLGLAIYRQLPEGVPGAYRILANLISAAKNPALQK